MSEQQDAQQQAMALPPPPYRAAAWYDPRVEHRPCECPRCRSGKKDARARRVIWRTLLVVAGGLLLPAASLLINAQINVVVLGLPGTVAILLAMLSALLHLTFSPSRKVLHDGIRVVKHHPPKSSALRIALLVLAGLSCLTWGYLALLFLPLVPLSVIGIMFVGIGLCGLCPYGAIAIALVQVVRDYRAVRDANGLKPARNILLATLLAPTLLVGGTATLAYFQRAELDAKLQGIERLPEDSAARYRVIATLVGRKQQLVDAYLHAPGYEGNKPLIAMVYRHLTDATIDAAVAERSAYVAVRQDGLIRPFAFLQGNSPVSDNVFNWRF